MYDFKLKNDITLSLGQTWMFYGTPLVITKLDSNTGIIHMLKENGFHIITNVGTINDALSSNKISLKESINPVKHIKKHSL